jgi:6-phosphogluconolactonase (cycloisomerase 2 family)
MDSRFVLLTVWSLIDMHCTVNRKHALTGVSILFVLATLAACGGGGGGGGSAPATYTVGGTVSGLAAGQGVVLQNNGGDNLTISANGIFTFATALNNSAHYAVTIFTPPAGQTCTVASDTGAIAAANVTDVTVACVASTYTIGGSVSGLAAGKNLVLRNNGGDSLSLGANGVFAFATALVDGTSYAVTVSTQPSEQTCAVGNASGTVSGASVANISVSCANTYSIGGTVSGLAAGQGVVLQNNAGDNLTLGANGTFTFATALPSTSAYNVSALIQPGGGRCTVSNAAGTIATANVTDVVVACVPLVARHAYVANFDDDSVSIYTVNAATGQLRHNGYVAAGANPRSISVDPAGQFAYVTNYGSNDVSAYRIEAGSGALTPIGEAVAAGINPRSVSVDPSGRFAYVAISGSNTDNVLAYRIDAASGALSAVPGSPFTAGTGPSAVSIDPSGQFVYVANEGSHDVSAYRLDAASGALMAITGSPFMAGTRPSAVSIDPSGQFAYVANGDSGNVSAFRIESATGKLTAVANSPFPAEAGASSIGVDPTGIFAYVANEVSGNVSAYRIDAATGALAPIGAAVAAGTNPRAVSIDPSGQFVHVANLGSTDVSAFRIDAATGALTSLGSVRARGGSTAIAMTRGTAAVSYTPKFVYVTQANTAKVSAYRIDTATGLLTAVAGSPFATGANPTGVGVDPSGRFAYVSNGGINVNNVSAYRIDATSGVLNAVSGSPFAAGLSPGAVSVDPSGRFAYVANLSSDNVSAFRIDTSNGALASAGAAVAAGTLPRAVSVDPSGRFVYVVNGSGVAGGNSVSAYRIDAGDGTLAPIDAGPTPDIQNFPAGTAPSSVSVDPSGRFAYVANSGSSNVSAYRINATTGALEAVTNSPFAAGLGPSSVAVHPSGEFVYVANGSSASISAYRIDASNGALIPIDADGAVVGIQHFPAGTNPRSISVDPSGQYAYVANFGDDNVSVQRIDTSSGALTFIGSVTGLDPNFVTTTGAIQ